MYGKVIVCIILISGFWACKKTYENPPYQPVNDGARLNIKQIKTRVKDSTSLFRFSAGDTNLYCTVSADETSANLYKQIFVRDDNGGAIQVNLLESGGLYVGDRIRINLNFLPVISANRMIYLDSVSLENSIVKISSGNIVHPLSVNLSSVIAQLNPLHGSSMQSQLVEISGVEFTADARNKPFGDVIGKTTSSYFIKNCLGNEAIVRTSGFANFASRPIPAGNGKLTALVTQYKNDIQLLIRNYNEINMNGQLCIPTATNTGKIYQFKNFDDASLVSGGWSSFTITNSSVKWSVYTFSGTPTPFARVSGFTGGINTESESWLISPPLGISSATNPVLTFETAAKFSGTPLEVLVSITYTGGIPTSSNWTSLAPMYILSSQAGSYQWTSSGNVPLNAYKHQETRVAFRYKSSVSGATTYELDDIVIKEN